jgi:ABC-type transporter Mla MlaB component
MASNFDISIHRNSENLHLKLTGDFDGASAFKLLNILKRNCRKASKVFIHCSCLKEIHPFGVAVFHVNLDALKGEAIQLIFTGENASLLAPEGNICFKNNSSKEAFQIPDENKFLVDVP